MGGVGAFIHSPSLSNPILGEGTPPPLSGLGTAMLKQNRFHYLIKGIWIRKFTFILHAIPSVIPFCYFRFLYKFWGLICQISAVA